MQFSYHSRRNSVGVARLVKCIHSIVDCSQYIEKEELCTQEQSDFRCHRSRVSLIIEITVERPNGWCAFSTIWPRWNQNCATQKSDHLFVLICVSWRIFMGQFRHIIFVHRWETDEDSLRDYYQSLVIFQFHNSNSPPVRVDRTNGMRSEIKLMIYGYIDFNKATPYAGSVNKMYNLFTDNGFSMLDRYRT